MSAFRPGSVIYFKPNTDNFNNVIGNLSNLIHFISVGLSILIIYLYCYHNSFGVVRKHIVWLHERGHDIHLRISAKIINIPYAEFCIDVDKSSDGMQYSGHTDNELYTYFEKEKKLLYIRVQAIAGSGTVVLICLKLIIQILLQPLRCIMPLVLIPGAVLFIEMCSFFKGTDYKHFLHPKDFHHTPRHIK